MSASGFWDLTTSTALPPNYGVMATLSTSPFKPYYPSVHNPSTNTSCRQADYAADQLIEGLAERLRDPCPHCGLRREDDPR